MLVEYLDSFFGPYVPVPDSVGFDSINWVWTIEVAFLILIFHCVMKIIISVLRRILQK